ncbi:MAG: hypothetical protein JKP92_00285 [Alphaproteobacteria bacterium]|jgi:hypothetical protein|nr:hypothetical protein [Alphaproteobacteria bacterium]
MLHRRDVPVAFLGKGVRIWRTQRERGLFGTLAEGFSGLATAFADKRATGRLNAEIRRADAETRRKNAQRDASERQKQRIKAKAAAREAKAVLQIETAPARAQLISAWSGAAAKVGALGLAIWIAIVPGQGYLKDLGEAHRTEANAANAAAWAALAQVSVDAADRLEHPDVQQAVDLLHTLTQ